MAFARRFSVQKSFRKHRWNNLVWTFQHSSPDICDPKKDLAHQLLGEVNKLLMDHD